MAQEDAGEHNFDNYNPINVLCYFIHNDSAKPVHFFNGREVTQQQPALPSSAAGGKIIA